MNSNNKKNSILLLILLSPFLILYYAFIGLKSLTYDFIKKNNLSKCEKISLVESDYLKIKGNIKVSSKSKKYNAKYLQSLEKEKNTLLKDLKEAGATRHNKHILYLYKVKDSYGKIISGTMKGFSKLDINTYLINEGYEVYSIKNSPWIDFVYQDSSIFGTSKLKDKDTLFFLTQLSTYLKAGISLNDSVTMLSKQVDSNSKKQKIFKAINYELLLGDSFSGALEKQGDLFPAFMINMIKAAEISGTLLHTLEELRVYYEELTANKKQIVSALTYPSIILVFSSVVITFILIYIVPQFTSIYSNGNTNINSLTAFIISVSDFLRNNILIIVLAIFMLFTLIIYLYKNNNEVQKNIQILLMKIPGIKNIIIYNEIIIFSKTFASLLNNNVYITDSIEILSNITNNSVYKSILLKSKEDVVKGTSLSSAFSNHWAVPEVLCHMIQTGEETGDLPNMMLKISDYYQTMHKTNINNLKTLIEPILTAILAIVVGIIIIAVIVPMYGIYSDISGGL